MEAYFRRCGKILNALEHSLWISKHVESTFAGFGGKFEARGRMLKAHFFKDMEAFGKDVEAFGSSWKHFGRN